MQVGEEVVLVGPEMVRPRCAALRLRACMFGYLLVLDAPLQPILGPEIQRLGDGDVADMVALRGVPEHGVLPPLRHRMGRFVGVRRAGALVAMAGENLNMDGYTEIAGLFTHPDERGSRLAQGLVRELAAGVQSRGDRPFAIVTATNMPSIRLFHNLGFGLRCDLVYSQVTRISGLGEQDIPPSAAHYHWRDGPDGRTSVKLAEK